MNTTQDTPIRPWPRGQMLPALRRELEALEERTIHTAQFLTENRRFLPYSTRQRGARLIAERERRCVAIRQFLAKREGGAA